jgi:hypothetical protein
MELDGSNEQFNAALDFLLKTNQLVYLPGKAGTGKTTFVMIHMVSSLDGIIARRDNSISWFDTYDNYDKSVDGQAPEEFPKTIDCYVMVSRTYEHADRKYLFTMNF